MLVLEPDLDLDAYRDELVALFQHATTASATTEGHPPTSRAPAVSDHNPHDQEEKR